MQKSKKLKLKDRSTLSKFDYIVDHILCGIFGGLGFVNIILPHFVPITYFERSFIKVILCLFVASLLGIGVSYRNRRTGKGVIIDILSGLGVYTILVLGKYVSGFLRSLIIGTVLITLVEIALIVCRKIGKKSKRRQIMFVRIIGSTQLVMRNFGIACAIVILTVPVLLHFGNNKQLSEDYYSIIRAFNNEEFGDHNHKDVVNNIEVHEVYGDEYRLSENIDTIKLIRDNETFQKLSYDQKCDVVTAILQCEGRYLGLEEFEINFSDDLDVWTLGQFSYSEKIIKINSRQLKDGNLRGGTADEVLNTCLHEARHYYQYLMIDLYKKASPEQRNLYVFTGVGVESWYENSKDYHSANTYEEETQFDYVTQPLEVDARQYAYEQVEIYHDEIDKLLKDQAD